MARRNIASTWKQFEKILGKCCDTESPDPELVEELRDLTDKVNSSKLREAISFLFVEPYSELEQVTVQFAAPNGTLSQDWATSFEAEEKIIKINPAGVYQFCRKCQAAAESLKTPSARESFVRYRLQAYFVELAKLPSHYILFLLILRQVANARKITQVVKKGGNIEIIEGDENRDYMNLLWAFKELEAFYTNSNGMSLRSEFGMLWHESDWIMGR